MDKTIDKHGVLKMLREDHPWIRNYIYMGPLKGVLQEFNVSPGVAGVVLSNYTDCFNKSTEYKYKNYLFSHHLDSYIFYMPLLKLTSR